MLIIFHFFSYKSYWVNLNRSNIKSLQIMQMSFNIPLTLNAYGVIVLSMDLFIKVIAINYYIHVKKTKLIYLNHFSF